MTAIAELQKTVASLDDYESVESNTQNPFLAELKNFKVNSELTNEEYHAIVGVSSSTLKEAKTPAHLQIYLTKERKPKEAFNVGTAFHTMFLEPTKFEYVLFDDSKIVAEIGGANPRATKLYKDWKTTFETDNAGKSILDKDTFSVMFAASKRAESFEIVKALIKNGQKELSLFADFKNLKLKLRPDCLTFVTSEIAELLPFASEGDCVNLSIKTTKDASPEGFKREFYKYKYHITEAFYNDLLTAMFECTVHTVFLAVEPETGLFALHHITSEKIEFGRNAYLPQLEICKNFDFKAKNTSKVLAGYEYNGLIINEL